MALPSLVRCTRNVSAIMATTETTMVISAARLMFTLPSVRLPLTMMSMLFVSAPKSSCAPFSSRNETPMAVMSSDRRGALRSGVYATFSMTTPSSVLTATASTTDSSGCR